MKFIFIACLALSSSHLIAQPQQQVQEYTDQRISLITEANSSSFVDSIALSDDEKQVNIYLQQLLAKEFETASFLPSRNFLECQKEIEKSLLYKFLQRMPKGGILHAHSPAIGDLHWLINNGTYRPDCYMYVGEPKDRLVKGTVKLFESQPTGQWEPIQLLRQKSGNSALFDQKLYESFVITPKDLALPHIWDKFSSCFHLYLGLFTDKKLYKTFIEYSLLQLLQEDNVQYIELRDTPQEDLILMYNEIIEEIQKQFPYFTLKIICDASRNKDRTKVQELAQETLRLKKKYPDIIAGFDLFSQEDTGHSISFYLEDFLELKNLSAKEHVELPFYFHAGETNWPFDTYLSDPKITSNDNLYDALLLNSKRVAHGLSLVKNPFLMNKFKQANIALEVCPISNQVLGFVKDLRNHPALSYLNAGLVVTINPDDPAIFGYKGVTPDIWEACVAWELDLRALKQLMINSITYSSLDPGQKTALLKVWEHKWNEFISETLQNIKTRR